jgi:hypothetical protein
MVTPPASEVAVMVAVATGLLVGVAEGVVVFVGVLEGVGVTATIVTTTPATGKWLKRTGCPFVPEPPVTLKR